MKVFLVGILVVFSSQFSFGEEVKTQCQFPQWSFLFQSIENQQVRVGKEFKEQLLEVLGQEWAPTCNVITNTVPRVTIPGLQSTEIEIVNATKTFRITVVNDLEAGQTYVIINKTRDENRFQNTEVKTACTPEQFLHLDSSVRREEVRYGAEHRDNLISILMQEIGPKCFVVTNTTARPTIPGQKSTVYEIDASFVIFRVSVIYQMEANNTYVSIEKTLDRN